MKKYVFFLVMGISAILLTGCCMEDFSCDGTTSTKYMSCASTAASKSTGKSCDRGCNYGCGSYSYNNGWY